MHQQFISVQILRFAAAMLVVAMHTTQAISIHITQAGHETYWSPGSAGVDIFFVISGFVMSTSVGRSIGIPANGWKDGWTFLKRRLLRIVPLYWFYTLAKVAVLIAVPVLAARSSVDLSHLLYSLFFIPVVSPWGPIEPLLPVGWTLNFEMLFYSIFALTIVLRLPRIRFGIGIFALIFLGASYWPDVTPLTFYAQFIIFEFVLGMGVAHLLFRFQPLAPTAGAVVSAFALAWMFGVNWDESTNRLIRWGFPAAFLLAGFVGMEPWMAKFRAGKQLSFLGDASYSIYLSHTFAVPAGVLLLRKLSVGSSVTVFGVVIALAIIAGCVSYLAVERPLTTFCRRLFF